MYFAENIKFLRQRDQLSQQQISDKLGISRTTLGDYERGHTEPNLGTLLNICNLYGIPAEVLLKYDLSNDKTELNELHGRQVLSLTMDQNGNPNIELIQNKAYAGYLEGFDKPEYVKELPKINLPSLKGKYYRAFEISGDSMPPMESGSIVVCSFIDQLKEIVPGKTYVLISRQSGIVYKRMYPDFNKNTLSLVSDNPTYPPVNLGFEDIDELWQYKAHISFMEPKQSYDSWMEEKINNIHSKVLDIHRKIMD